MRITESILIESLDRTSWGDGDCVDKITLGEVLEYFKDKNIMPEIFDTRELFYKFSRGKEVLSIVKKGGKESERRVEDASLEYPIIVVMRDGDIEYVLDGNHRLQKVKMIGEESIKVLVLDLDDDRVPEMYRRIF